MKTCLQGLFRKILNGHIKPGELVKMTPEELASKELARWREFEAKHVRFFSEFLKLWYSQCNLKKNQQYRFTMTTLVYDKISLCSFISMNRHMHMLSKYLKCLHPINITLLLYYITF